jgi:peptidoglycan/xylan/chitin deacetylase (PgdA/CDA1 family)
VGGPSERVIAPLRAPIGVPVARMLDLLSRRSARRAGLVIVYHRVDDPAQDPDEYLVPAMGTKLFEAQLRHLLRTYRVVPPSEILVAVEARRRGERFPVAVTFDDDLPTHVRTAIPIMRRLGVPTTFFLSGASLESPFAFWWERLDRALNRGLVSIAEVCEWIGLPTGSKATPHIYELTAAIEELEPDQRDLFAERLRERIGPDPPDSGMRAADVKAAAAAGFEIGFHTRRHDVLPGLDDAALDRALVEGRAELEELIGDRITSISYPAGKADARVANAVRAAGYRHGFAVQHVPVRPDSDPLLVPRMYEIHQSLGHFALRLARVIRTAPSSD